VLGQGCKLLLVATTTPHFLFCLFIINVNPSPFLSSACFKFVFCLSIVYIKCDFPSMTHDDTCSALLSYSPHDDIVLLVSFSSLIHPH